MMDKFDMSMPTNAPSNITRNGYSGGGLVPDIGPQPFGELEGGKGTHTMKVKKLSVCFEGLRIFFVL
jgi:hypothetical protein